jgi:hypothetical protein
MAYNLAPWFGLAVLALRVGSAAPWRRLVGPFGVAFLSVLCAAQIAAGVLRAPYRLNEGLAQQSQPTEIGFPRTILRLDPPTSAFFRQLRTMAAANGLKPGDDILAFFDMPGVVFALGGRSPGTPWYTWGRPGSARMAADRLSTVPRERIARAFILESSDGSTWLRGARPPGIRFPENYVLCGEVLVPYAWFNQPVRLWRPR